MEEKNKKERRRAKSSFAMMFAFTLLLFLLFGVLTLHTAQEGIGMLENKKALYDEIFRKQADFNFRIDDIYRNMNSLTTKERTSNEHKQLQLIIARDRTKMQDDLGYSEADTSYYAIYRTLLEQVRSTQETIDNYDKEKRRREYNLEQLQKGRRILR